jgi:hypothetical protein
MSFFLRYARVAFALTLTAAAGCSSASPSYDAKSAPSRFYGGMAPTVQAESTDADGSGDGLALGEAAPEAAKTPQEQPAQPPGGGQPAPQQTTPQGPGMQQVGADRKSPILIYKADFHMSVYEVQKSLDGVQALAEKAGGYLSRRDDRSITIRVPAGNFQGVVDEITKLGDVLSRNVVSEDVTAEYRDLEVQLENQLAMRDRFQKLLEKAQKVDEALAIEKELGRVAEEIDRIKGRLKLLADLAQYSTITVNFAPRADQQLQQGPFILPLPWLNDLGLPRLMQL